jgi:hypothetical protein
MKKIIHVLFCLTLTAAAGLAKDYPVLDKDVHMAVRAIADGSAAEASPIYVLLLPDHNPVIFKTFDSKGMERVIRDCLASGSVLHYDPNPDIEVPTGRPTSAQLQELKDFCKKLGITFVVSQTA